MEQVKAGHQDLLMHFFEWLNNIYERLLRWTLRHRWLMISGGVVAIILGVFLFKLLPSELVPVEDRGVGFGIVIAPEGATLEYTDSYVKEIEKRFTDTS